MRGLASLRTLLRQVGRYCAQAGLLIVCLFAAGGMVQASWERYTTPPHDAWMERVRLLPGYVDSNPSNPVVLLPGAESEGLQSALLHGGVLRASVGVALLRDAQHFTYITYGEAVLGTAPFRNYELRTSHSLPRYTLHSRWTGREERYTLEATRTLIDAYVASHPYELSALRGPDAGWRADAHGQWHRTYLQTVRWKNGSTQAFWHITVYEDPEWGPCVRFVQRPGSMEAEQSAILMNTLLAEPNKKGSL